MIFFVFKVVGGLAAMIGNLDQSHVEFRRKVSDAQTYLKDNAISPRIRRRLTKYYEYQWNKQGGVDELRVLTNLPTNLRIEIATSIAGNLIMGIPFFAYLEKNEAVKNAIIACLKHRIFLPSDIMIHVNDVGFEMFVIERGNASVRSQNGTLLCLLSSGHHWCGNSFSLFGRGGVGISSSALAYMYLHIYL
jgi:hypothetical protein